MDAIKFGLFISETRKEKHLTQAQLAGKLNVTDKAVSRWERGLGFPDIGTIEPLADALGVSVLELMQAKRGEKSELLSTQKAEEILLSTIHLPDGRNRAFRAAGIIILSFFCCIGIWLLGVLLTDWSILNYIVISIFFGLFSWAVPIFKVTLSKSLQICSINSISFISAMFAILFRVLNMANNINSNDTVAVIDTINSEVMIIVIFIIITAVLNMAAIQFCDRIRKASGADNNHLSSSE